MSRRFISRRVEALEAQYRPRSDDRWEQFFERLSFSELEALEPPINSHRRELDDGTMSAAEFAKKLPNGLREKLLRFQEQGQLPQPCHPDEFYETARSRLDVIGSTGDPR